MHDFTQHRDVVASASSLKELEELRVTLLGKKGLLTQALKDVASLPMEERKTRGKELNVLKQSFTTDIEARKDTLQLQEESAKLAQESLDITLPPSLQTIGKIHPISHVMQEMEDIFASMGFTVRTGSLIEDEEHNFDALNIPEHHPARQMHDTFYLAKGEDAATGDVRHVLRTHTSPVQIRTMRNETPPIRIIAPGATFRCDSDQTHTPMFHQMEGLYIDKDVHMGHLKGCITRFLQLFFDNDALEVRFRPSFFPFTEPSAEIDIGCTRSKASITVGGTDDWLEVMGCGMVHPNVLTACNVDTSTYQGFAFGMGVERLAMLKYNIPDLRTFFDSRKDWLHHYGF